MHGIQTQHITRGPPPPPALRIVGSKIALFISFGAFAWANMGQIWLKIASNHLFEHPKWSRNKFGKNHFRPLLDPQVTPVTLPYHVRHARSTTQQCQNGGLKGVDNEKMACK